MINYSQIKKNYDNEIWTKIMVSMCVRKGIISEEQFKTITGDEYDGKESSDV